MSNMSINDDDTGSLPDLDMDFESGPEASALQAVADSMAQEQQQQQQPAAAAPPPRGADHERSPSTSGNERDAPGKKRSSPTPLEDLNAPAGKVTKRRAARACVRYATARRDTRGFCFWFTIATCSRLTDCSCRARKVRCDVVEGAPCGNCRWDNVECIVQESRRRK